jgi:hypothetical protein
MDDTAIQERYEEEQRQIEAQIRARGAAAAPNKKEGEKDGSVTNRQSIPRDEAPVTPTPHTPPPPGSFGSSLERSPYRRMASSTLSEDNISVMTPEHRQQVEEHVRAQHTHPLAMRLQAEEAERRWQNEREYYQQNPHRQLRRQLLESSTRRGRDWNRIVDAFERSGNGTVNSLDDLVVLEAAIMLSMEEEARRRGETPEMSTTESSRQRHPSQFDAARHASAGFPLARERLGRAEREVEALRELRRQRMSGMLRPSGGVGGRWLMRGISEEEQIAMAIAASLQDQQHDGMSSTSGSATPGGTEQEGAATPLTDAAASDLVLPSASDHAPVDAPPVPLRLGESTGGAAAADADESAPGALSPGPGVPPPPSGLRPEYSVEFAQPRSSTHAEEEKVSVEDEEHERWSRNSSSIEDYDGVEPATTN